MPSLQTQTKVSKLSRITRGRRTLLFCALVIPVIVLLLILLGLQRSYLIEAETGFVRLELQGTNAWSLRDVTICTPRERPNRSAVSSAGEACSAFDQEMQSVPSLTLEWLDGTPAVVRAEATPVDPRIRIILPSGLGDTYEPGTEIVVTSNPSSPTGALLFSGAAILGTVLGSGERYFLQSATWEARQTSWATRWLRSSTEKVMTGDALRGAELTVVERYRDHWWQLMRNTRSATVFGHLTPSFSGGDEFPSLSVTLVSEPGSTELQVGYFGLADPSRIRPDLLDTTATSVLLIAAIALLSLASAATQLASDLMSAGRDPDISSEKAEAEKADSSDRPGELAPKNPVAVRTTDREAEASEDDQL